MFAFLKLKLKMAQGHYVIPKLVEDVSLKRARIDNDENDTSTIRTTGGDAAALLTQVIGNPDDPSTENTVIGLLKRINSRF